MPSIAAADMSGGDIAFTVRGDLGQQQAGAHADFPALVAAEGR